MSLHDTQPDDDIQRQFNYEERYNAHCDKHVAENLQGRFENLTEAEFEVFLETDQNIIEDIVIMLRGIRVSNDGDLLIPGAEITVSLAVALQKYFEEDLWDEASLTFGDET